MSNINLMEEAKREKDKMKESDMEIFETHEPEDWEEKRDQCESVKDESNEWKDKRNRDEAEEDESEEDELKEGESDKWKEDENEDNNIILFIRKENWPQIVYDVQFVERSAITFRKLQNLVLSTLNNYDLHCPFIMKRVFHLDLEQKININEQNFNQLVLNTNKCDIEICD